MSLFRSLGQIPAKLRRPTTTLKPGQKPTIPSKHVRIVVTVPANSIVTYADEPAQCFANPGTYTYTPTPGGVLTIKTIYARTNQS